LPNEPRLQRLADWLIEAQEQLSAAGVESARLDAQLLAARAFNAGRPWVLAHARDVFDVSAAEALLARRLRREPLAYILCGREFYGRWFGVTSSVLIPRQETETLVTAALELNGKQRVLDLGTGSGCLAVTLKLERPNWEVCASDISPDALHVARVNAQSLGVQIRLVHSDLFSVFEGERFDLIVTNPPYIGTSEDLMPEVALFEPAIALFAGPDGLDFYRRLATEAHLHLTEPGRLLTEVGYAQADAVATLFERHGWRVDRVINDLSGVPRALACGCPSRNPSQSAPHPS
jgi:release factor glutamine methyltransferase